MKVLVVGASGPHAGLVVPELVQRGVVVRALVRGEDRAQIAKSRGAEETVIGDLEDADSLRRAAEGVEGVFHTNPAFAPHEDKLGVAMVDAAKAMGVRKVVFSSVYHPSISAMINHRSKQPVEEALFGSGMDFTILQPSMFMQNLDEALTGARRSGQFAMPYSADVPTCWVDYRDVAEVTALAMTGDKLSYGTFELSSRGQFDRHQIAVMMGNALGRTVTAGTVDRETWAAGLPAGPLRDGLEHMMGHYDEHGFPGGNAVVLRAILGREPRSLQEYFDALAGAADNDQEQTS